MVNPFNCYEACSMVVKWENYGRSSGQQAPEKRSIGRGRMTRGMRKNAAVVGTVRGLNRRSVKNAAMTLSSWLSSGAKARREVATNGQRINASQPSGPLRQAIIQTFDVRLPVNMDDGLHRGSGY
jgi:hypothetical protein